MRAAPLLAFLLAAATSHAQTTATTLTVTDVTASYSHAADVTLTLRTAPGGTAVPGAQVTVLVRAPDDVFSVDVGQVPTGADGTATLRIPLVNGCPLWASHALQAGPTATPVAYALMATFTGDTLGGTQYLGSAGQGTLSLVKESAQVKIVSGTSGELGETLTLTAKIEDSDGNAPCDRSATTGPGPVTVDGHRLAFFWDVNLDHDYSDARESLGSANTGRPNPDADATAAVEVDTTPVNNEPRAGTWDGALQVQLPSDDTLYLPATAVGRLVLLPAPVLADRTTMTADPPDPQAGASDTVVITVTLRDRFDNPLDAESPEHAVKVEIDGPALGAAMDGEQATRDVITGKYTQSMYVARRKGTVRVRAFVDGQPGSTLDIPHTGLFPVGPCACALPGGRTPLPAAMAVSIVAALFLRRRARRVDTP
ncbi:MAG: hypothetical protein HY904_08250 [Deltaproteobacteria bacterium]|nr:hypothetical protein [Deltaproteobacteria bacterium]